MVTSTFPHQYAATQRFTLGAPRTLSVSKDGTQVFFLRSKAADDPTLCLWRFDVRLKEEFLLADPRSIAKELGSTAAVPPEELARRERARESGAGIVAYTLDEDGTSAVFSLDGSLLIANTQTGQVNLIGSAEGVFDPRISPSGTDVAYVSGQTLRLATFRLGGSTVNSGEHDDQHDRLLLSDDDPLVSWGRAEFIAGEEMGRTRGYWWSPEGDSLLVTRVDEGPVAKRWIGDPANPDCEPVSTRYPAAGTANAVVDLAMVTLEGATTMVDWREDRFEYLANIVWSHGHAPLLVRQTRDQKEVSIAELNLGSMTLTEIHTIQDSHWVELIPGSPTWSDHGLLTIEDLDQQRSLCLDGVALSEPELQVRSILSSREDEVLVTASVDPTEIQLVFVSLLDGGSRTLSSHPGVHGGAVGGSTVAVQSSLPNQSQTVVTIQGWGDAPNPEGGDTPQTVLTNHAATPVLTANPTYLTLGQSELRSALFLPETHDGQQPLPVLLDPYGGPHAQRVLKVQNANLVSQWFANQGFAVLVTDGRGTPGRGPSFERSVWGDLAQPVLDDQIEALDAAGQIYPFLDLGRVGIRGWSFGGYLAALAVLRRPDRFHAAVAGAPVTTWDLYDTHYTERYLGHPDEHRENYERSDLIPEAGSLSRPLFLIHGLADDNVIAAHTLRLSSALLAAGRPHRVLPLTGVTHMTPQAVVAKNLLLLQRDFLISNLVNSPSTQQPAIFPS